MFRSAKGKDPPSDAPQRPDTSAYSSFRDIYEDEQRKQDHSSLTDSEASDKRLIEEQKKRKRDKKRRKKQEKDQRKLQKKKKESPSKKKRRRDSSPDSDIEILPNPSTSKRRRDSSPDSDIEVLSNPSTSNDDFMEDRKRTLNSYNYKFERAIKSKPLRLETKMPLTWNRDPLSLKVLLYGEGERVKWRYYDSDTREQLKKNPTERVFRKPTGPLFIDGVMEVSNEPCDPNEFGYRADYDYFDFNEDISAKSRKFEKFEGMTERKKDDQIRSDVMSNDSTIGSWLAFLRRGDEEFACVSRAEPNSANRNSFLERRLAIINAGLKKVSATDSLKLHLEYLNTLTELHGYFHENVKFYWKMLQNIHVNSLELWEAFIQQLIHNSSNFKLNDALRQFDVAIDKLMGVASGTLKSHRLLPGTSEFIIDLVVNRTRLLMETGHIYVVIAIIQAIAEFQFFMPSTLEDANWEERFREFGKFLKSGHPRVGDKYSKGWTNDDFDGEKRERMVKHETNYEAGIMTDIDKIESDICDSLSKSDDSNRLFAWSELEQGRARHFWKPVRPLTELINDEKTMELKKRLIDFEGMRTSLLPLGNRRLALKLLLRLLQILGAVVPGYEDDSQASMLRSVLPDDFNFLRQNYNGLSTFLVEFMFQLCSSTDIVELEQVLVSIVATKIHLMELENEDSTRKLTALKLLEARIMRMEIGLTAKYCALLQIYEGYASCLDLRKSFTGAELNNFFEHVERKSSEQRLLENVIKIFDAGDPFNIADQHMKQIILKAAVFLSINLPSHRAGFVMNRLRFLSFLVLGRTKDFLQEDENLSAEDIDTARSIWFGHIRAILKVDEIENGFYPFMEAPNDLIFMLCAMFEFEYKEACPFSTSLQYTGNFIGRSKARTLFRLSFSHELWQAHTCEWTNYSKWTLSAVEKYPNFTALYSHLSNVFGAKSCHFRHFVEWKILDPNIKRQQALAMFAAEYRLFQKASEMEEPLFVDQSYKRIRQIFEEAAPLFSDSFKPDSFIWRLWHFIEREGRKSSEMEKVYLLGVRSCPFAKQLLVDVTLSPFTPKNRLEEIKDLSDKFGLCLFTLPTEADVILEAALKMSER